MCVCVCVLSHSVVTDPMGCSLPGSSVHEISQAKILGWVAISFSMVSSWSRDWTHVSCIVRQIPYHQAAWEAPQPVGLSVRMMLNVSFFPLLFKVIPVQSHISRFDTDLKSPYWNILDSVFQSISFISHYYLPRGSQVPSCCAQFSFFLWPSKLQW